MQLGLGVWHLVGYEKHWATQIPNTKHLKPHLKQRLAAFRCGKVAGKWGR